jgi:type VI secretion system protein ImpK
MSNHSGDGPPSSGDRTIIKPRPGAGRAVAGPGAAPPPPPRPPDVAPPPQAASAPQPTAREAPSGAVAPGGGGRFEFSATGLDPLVAAAGPLLLLAGRLRHTTDAADTAGLRRQLVEEVRQFEETARRQGVVAEQIAAARYALCATLDEAILSTPWGARGEWAAQPLLSIFHRETWGGEKFFQLVERTKSDPRQYAGLLEVLYACLSLGFAGKFALQPQGELQRDTLRHEVFERLRSLRSGPPGPLSAHWEGEHDRRNPVLRYVPLWVVAAVGLALLTGVYLYFRFQLNQAAEPTLAALAGVGVQEFAAETAPPLTAPRVTLKQLLADLESQGLVEVAEAGGRSTVTLAGSDLFAPGSARINQRFEPVIERIGDALEELPGPVLVVGHSDSQPIRSFRYQNNFELSADRALAVVKRLEARMSAPGRLQSNGVGSTQPRAVPEDTAENRALNRRVEVVHVLSGDTVP